MLRYLELEVSNGRLIFGVWNNLSEMTNPFTPQQLLQLFKASSIFLQLKTLHSPSDINLMVGLLSVVLSLQKFPQMHHEHHQIYKVHLMNWMHQGYLSKCWECVSQEIPQKMIKM